jgi:hypothetical protein
LDWRFFNGHKHRPTNHDKNSFKIASGAGQWEVSLLEKKNELPGYVQVPANYPRMVERFLQEQKSYAVSEYLERKKAELGTEKFEKQRPKLEAEAHQHWKLAQDGKEQFRKLQEQSERKLMEWKLLEKSLRQWLENEAEYSDWGQDAVERTIPSYRNYFERNQNHIRSRQNQIRDPDADFRQRVLNPETRREAIKKYVQNHRDWRHYTVEALNILFEQLEKRRWKKTPSRKADLKKERERAHKPAAGYPVIYPAKDAEVERLRAEQLKKKKPPAWREAEEE